MPVQALQYTRLESWMVLCQWRLWTDHHREGEATGDHTPPHSNAKAKRRQRTCGPGLGRLVGGASVAGGGGRGGGG
jgi:hypothetical protein